MRSSLATTHRHRTYNRDDDETNERRDRDEEAEGEERRMGCLHTCEESSWSMAAPKVARWVTYTAACGHQRQTKPNQTMSNQITNEKRQNTTTAKKISTYQSLTLQQFDLVLGHFEERICLVAAVAVTIGAEAAFATARSFGCRGWKTTQRGRRRDW